MEAVLSRLERYSLPQVLAILGRVSAVFRDKSVSATEIQETLAHAFFPPAQLAELKTRARAAARSDSGEDQEKARYVMFDPQVAKAPAIFAGANLPVAKADTDASPVFIGEALLILNDLFEADVAPSVDDPSTPNPNWVYYFAFAAYRFGVEPTVSAIVRAVEVFLDPSVDEGSPQTVDLAAAFEDATGLALGAYAMLCIAVIGKMLEVDASNAHQQVPTISRTYFDGFDSTLRERFRQLVGTPIAQFCEMARDAWPEGATRPRHWLPIEKSPFVWTDTVGICISTEELERRLTVGLYHTLLNAKRRSDNGDRKFSAAVQREVGRRFQSYVARAFSRLEKALVDRTAWHPRERRKPGPVLCVTESELVAAAQQRSKKTPSVCDYALLIGQDLLLIEVKAKFFDLETRTGRSQERFFRKLEEIVIAGADQLNESVGHLRLGRLAALGLSSTRVRRVFPIIVSLEPIPLSPPLRSWIENQLEDKGLLQSSPEDSFQLSPLEVFAARYLEWLEALIDSEAVRPGDLLAAKANTAFGRSISLATWSATKPSLMRQASRAYPLHHETRWNSLAEGAAEFFARGANAVFCVTFSVRVAAHRASHQVLDRIAYRARDPASKLEPNHLQNEDLTWLPGQRAWNCHVGHTMISTG